MSIKKMPNYNTGIDLSSVSISEATYMLNSFIEESINDIHTRCLLADKRSLNESGVLYFTEENETGKQKLGDKIKQIIKTVWDVIVGIFKKIRDFFKDMIEKLKEFFSKIQKKIFGKKKEEKKSDEKKDGSKAEEKKEESKNRPFNTEKINTVQDEDGLHQVDQKELIQYMKDLNDNVFRDAIDKNVTAYYNTAQCYDDADLLLDIAGKIDKLDLDNYVVSGTSRKIQKSIDTPLPEINKQNINKGLVLDYAFGDYNTWYKNVDKMFKSAEKLFDNLYKKSSDTQDPQMLIIVKELLKLTTKSSKRFSSAMIHNTKELMKVVHYIYNNYDRDGVSVKESVDWSSIL